jgi:hypothetical protein
VCARRRQQRAGFAPPAPDGATTYAAAFRACFGSLPDDARPDGVDDNAAADGVGEGVLAASASELKSLAKGEAVVCI